MAVQTLLFSPRLIPSSLCGRRTRMRTSSLSYSNVLWLCEYEPTPGYEISALHRPSALKEIKICTLFRNVAFLGLANRRAGASFEWWDWTQDHSGVSGHTPVPAESHPRQTPGGRWGDPEGIMQHGVISITVRHAVMPKRAFDRKLIKIMENNEDKEHWICVFHWWNLSYYDMVVWGYYKPVIWSCTVVHILHNILLSLLS